MDIKRACIVFTEFGELIAFFVNFVISSISSFRQFPYSSVVLSKWNEYINCFESFNVLTGGFTYHLRGFKQLLAAGTVKVLKNDALIFQVHTMLQVLQVVVLDTRDYECLYFYSYILYILYCIYCMYCILYCIYLSTCTCTSPKIYDHKHNLHIFWTGAEIGPTRLISDYVIYQRCGMNGRTRECAGEQPIRAKKSNHQRRQDRLKVLPPPPPFFFVFSLFPTSSSDVITKCSVFLLLR